MITLSPIKVILEDTFWKANTIFQTSSQIYLINSPNLDMWEYLLLSWLSFVVRLSWWYNIDFACPAFIPSLKKNESLVCVCVCVYFEKRSFQFFILCEGWANCFLKGQIVSSLGFAGCVVSCTYSCALIAWKQTQTIHEQIGMSMFQ